MKIFHIDTGLTLRGGQRQLLRLAEGLRERGHQQTIVAPEESELARQAGADGHQVLALPSHDMFYAHGIVLLHQALLALPIAILHAHDGRAQTLSWLASGGLPVRRVASRRVTFLPQKRILHRLVYSHTCSAVIAVSQFVRGLLVESGIPACNIEVIPDGIEIPDTPPSPEERARARAEWQLSPLDFVIGYMGAATPEKGLDVSVAAMGLLSRRRPQVKLVIMGDIAASSQAKLLALSSDARQHIQFLPSQDSVRPFFAALDLFWMPSRAEGLGSAALMAMAHGIPVVASRAGGLPEVVEDGKTGWLVAVGDPEALAEVTDQAATRPDRMNAMREAARERSRLFATGIMVARTERLYQQLA